CGSADRVHWSRLSASDAVPAVAAWVAYPLIGERMPWLADPADEELHDRRENDDGDDDGDLPAELVGEHVGAVAAELLHLGRHPLARRADPPRGGRVAAAGGAERLRRLGVSAVRTGPRHGVRYRGGGSARDSSACAMAIACSRFVFMPMRWNLATKGFCGSLMLMWVKIGPVDVLTPGICAMW